MPQISRGYPTIAVKPQQKCLAAARPVEFTADGVAEIAKIAAGGISPFRERRRRTRAVPHKAGQTLVAVGTVCLGIALIGRDTWRYTTLTILIGVVLLVAGAIMNRVYLKEVLFFRGAARRGQGTDNTRVEKNPPKTRIR